MDEAFIELSDPAQSVADLAASNNYVFVMRSLTKDFAIPGIRMGFGIASPEMAEILNTARLSWNLGTVANAIGTALLNIEGGIENPYLKKARVMIREEGEKLKAKLDRIRGFKAGEVNVNFIFVNISKFMLDSSELSARLAARGVLVRDCVFLPRPWKGLHKGCSPDRRRKRQADCRNRGCHYPVGQRTGKKRTAACDRKSL